MSDSKQIMGASLPRRDALRLAVGRGTFTDDIVLPRMLHMALVRSPYAHALIKSIDITDAKNVRAIFEEIGALDVLIANAGLERITPITDVSQETEATFR